MLSECDLVVSESGRQRVLETGHKNVHAYVRGSVEAVEGFKSFKGRIVPPELFSSLCINPRASEICYNPFEGPTFRVKSDNTPIYWADRVTLHGKGVVVEDNF